MPTSPVSSLVGEQLEALAPLLHFFTASTWARRREEPRACDFVLGNPHDMPLEGYVRALQRWVEPRDKDWFAYKMSEPQARATIAASLRERFGLPFDEQDVTLTNGAFGALAVTLRAVVDPGDEVIFLSPPWFFYTTLIRAAGGAPVRVHVDPGTWDPDLAAIEAAITPRTRAIIVNTPNNPTGRIYPPAALEALGRLLEAASQRAGRTIYLLSDESYSRILFDGRAFYTPTAFYPSSFLIYTYGKTLLTPGERLGYIALPPNAPQREHLRPALLMSQVLNGYAVANGLLQHALGDIEPLSVDVPRLQARRDRLVAELRAQGYKVNSPEATFYVLVRSPLADDLAFVELLARRDVFVLPGASCELPGYVRVSLTANEAMLERALPAFAEARQEALASRTSATAR